VDYRSRRIPGRSGRLSRLRQAYLDARWHTFDARNTTPRIGRVAVGRGRDAIDVALITSFGPLPLTGFGVRAEPRAASNAT
jgi:transglutaminase-like putative cysteine protease